MHSRNLRNSLISQREVWTWSYLQEESHYLIIAVPAEWFSAKARNRLTVTKDPSAAEEGKQEKLAQDGPLVRHSRAPPLNRHEGVNERPSERR